ncbi:uncharacterized protein LOC111391528 [Olea europaea var. sylvestris]|uniref:uncharacterized protein LOC111391528 n=1 Tax=Olea europaea var. sylvestris TaxID=158386 RepID=UPI000C1D37E5|nr:uncharacterized protein LOC111391528 [Olea europaea var. sylvestris]
MNHMIIALVPKANHATTMGVYMPIARCNSIYKFLRQYNRKRVVPRCLLKIDLRKAYDSVDWDFLKRVLEGLGFPIKFIGRVMECITVPTYSIALYGSLYRFIKERRALHQDNLAFTDYLMLYARGDVILVGILMECLSKFGGCRD